MNHKEGGGGVLTNMDAVVISMQADRFADAAAELAPYGVVPRHFQAVKGAALSPEELADTVTADARVKLQTKRGGLPSLGAVGCYLSHVAVWRSVVASRRTTLVFEDDVVGARGGRIDEALDAASSADKDWDVLLLDAILKQRKKARPTSSPRIARLPEDGDFACTTAYAITPAGAAKLLKGALPLHVEVDGYMSAAARLGAVNILLSTPRLFKQHGRWRSTIQRASLADGLVAAIRSGGRSVRGRGGSGARSADHGAAALARLILLSAAVAAVVAAWFRPKSQRVAGRMTRARGSR